MKKIKQLLLFCAACTTALYSTQANAQETTSAHSDYTKFYIGVTGGLSAPFGNFTKSDFNDPTSGFASSGGNIGLTATYFFGRHFGINALFTYHGYGFKGAQNLADGFKDAFDIDSSTVNIKGSNHSVDFLIGPYYSVPVSKRFAIDFRALVGVTGAHLAGNQVFMEDQGPSTFTQNEASATAFEFQLGVAGRYSLSKHFGLMINVDYYNSKPDFDITYENRNNNAGRWITKYDEPITGINANISVLYTIMR